MNIIITGASRGIGKAIAEKFAHEGHSLFLCARNKQRLEETTEELKQKFPTVEIHHFKADLSLQEACIAFYNWFQHFKVPADVLINNAGTFVPGTISDQEDGIMQAQMAINFYSAYHTTRQFLPAMKLQKEAHIFNICSIASIEAYANGGAYSISKFALYGFNKNLREELKPHNIKVTAVLPGAVFTDSWGDFDNTDNRIMIAKDIAELIYSASLLSPAACVEEIIVRPQLGDL